MIMKKFIALFLLSTLISACKIDIEKDVSLKDLLNKPVSTEFAKLNVEIAACNDYNDSRKQSDNLLEVQQRILTIFPQSKYLECYRNRLSSFAVFDIPIGVGYMDMTDNIDLYPDLTLMSFKDENYTYFLNMFVSYGFKQKLKELKEKDFLVSDLKMSLIINVKNDLEKTREAEIISSYINDKPYPDGVDITFNANSGKVIKIKLSDVAIDKLFNEENNTSSSIGIIKGKN